MTDEEKRIRIAADRLRSRYDDELRVFVALLGKDAAEKAAPRAVHAVETLYRYRRGDPYRQHATSRGKDTGIPTCLDCKREFTSEEFHSMLCWGPLGDYWFCPGMKVTDDAS